MNAESEPTTYQEFDRRQDDVTDVVCRALKMSFPEGEYPVVVASSLINVAVGTLIRAGLTEEEAKAKMINHLQTASFSGMKAIQIADNG